MKPIWPIVGTIVWGLALIPALFAVMFSPMIFDAPDSTKNPTALTFFWTVISFPILCVVAIAATWILWAIFRNSPSGFVRALPAIALLLPLFSVGFFVLNLR